jgi:hypothetical protein
VTLGGGEVATYVSWSDTSIVVELGPATATGQVVVTVNAQSSSGGPSFTVRPGTIYCVKTTGSNSNSGQYQDCWLTLPHAVQNAALGGTIYSHGVSQAADDGEGWNAAITLRVAWCGLDGSGYPRALVAYPGTTVTVGVSAGGPSTGIRATDSSAVPSACTGGWTFAGLTVRGQSAIDLNGQSAAARSTHWRIINNDMSCPNGDGANACFHSSRVGAPTKVLGNNIHDAGVCPVASALYHGLYPSTDSVGLEIAWNSVGPVCGCRGIHTHSSSGLAQFDISVHDNVVHDTQCDGILLATIDPSQGGVSVYNNVIYNAGKGPANPEGSGSWSCILVPGSNQSGPPGSGEVQVFNNTMYNCGSYETPPYPGRSCFQISRQTAGVTVTARLRNNLCYVINTAGDYYVNDSGDSAALSGQNNLWFGDGAPPADANFTGNVNNDPGFVNAVAADFHLAAVGSPANGAGTTTLFPVRDYDGVIRPSPPSIGAYEFAGGLVSSKRLSGGVRLTPGTRMGP